MVDILSVSCQYDFGGLSNRRTGTIIFTSEGIKVEGRLSLSGGGGLIGLAIRGAAAAAGIGRVDEFIPWSDVLFAEVKGLIGKRVEIKYRKEGSTKTLRLFVSSDFAERIEELVNRMKGSVPGPSEATSEEPQLEPSPRWEESYTPPSPPITEPTEPVLPDTSLPDYSVSSPGPSHDDLEDFEIVGTAASPVTHRFVDDTDFEVLTPPTSAPSPTPNHESEVPPVTESSLELPDLGPSEREGIDEGFIPLGSEEQLPQREAEVPSLGTIRITDLLVFKPDPQKIYIVVFLNTSGLPEGSPTLANFTAELKDSSGNVIYTETWNESLIGGSDQSTTKEMDLSQLGMDLSGLTVNVRVQIGDMEASAEEKLN